MKMSQLCRFTSFKSDKLTRAIHRGMVGLSFRFCSPGPVPRVPHLNELISQSDSIGLHPDALSSQFIVDGRHLPCSRIDAQEDPRQYFSFKLKHTAIQFQVVVTHLGECVHVSNWARAATHDLEVYRATRVSLLQKLHFITGNEQVKILADEGYRSQGIDEIITSGANHASFNRYRLVVENFFGRMCAVFLVGNRRINIGQDMYDPLIKSLCFLTSIHISSSPLRPDECVVYYAHDISLSTPTDRRHSSRSMSSRAYRLRRSENREENGVSSTSAQVLSAKAINDDSSTDDENRI